jgi:hypothetical protein
LWEPSHGCRGRGRPKASCIDTLKRDTGSKWYSGASVMYGRQNEMVKSSGWSAL